MPASYEVRLLNPFGQPILNLDQIVSLKYTLTVNAIGSATLIVPRSRLDPLLITGDTGIEIWRTPSGGNPVREGDGPWLVQAHTRGTDANGTAYWRLRADTANTLLSRRDAMYYATNAAVTKTGNADNVMKAIIRENLGASADASPISGGSNPVRNWTSVGLGVDGDTSAGPSTTKGFAWREVFSVLQEIARDAATNGTPVYFDLVGDASALTFRTYVGVRGSDRSTGPGLLTVSMERGSLGGTVEVTEEWKNVASHVVAGGSGQDTARVINHAYDSTLIGLSRFGNREVFIERTQLSDTNSLLSEARAELRRRRPIKVLTGSLISVPGAVYGLDWGFGDKLVAEYEEDAFTVRVDSVTVEVTDKEDKVIASLKSDTA